MELRLSELREGQGAVVLGMEASGRLEKRLRNFGMIEGTRVECIRRAPGGSPILYGLRGSLLALRRGDGDKIWVKGI